MWTARRRHWLLFALIFALGVFLRLYRLDVTQPAFAPDEIDYFLSAKACGVKVLEFSIGMGPAILKKQGKETLYSLRLLPIGGFCSMEGEDTASGDPRAFNNQSPLKRVLILVSGAAMNFLVGLVLILALYAAAEGFI